MAELLPLLDGIKIDFKAFSHSFYKDVCSAKLRPVLDSLIQIKQHGTWAINLAIELAVALLKRNLAPTARVGTAS